MHEGGHPTALSSPLKMLAELYSSHKDITACKTFAESFSQMPIHKQSAKMIGELILELLDTSQKKKNPRSI